jgi:hypothetical protein
MVSRVYTLPVVLLASIFFLGAGCVSLSEDIKSLPDSCEGRNEVTKIPGWDMSYQIEPSCGFPDPADTSLALHIFYMEWHKRFGDRSHIVLKNLNRLVIEWRQEKMVFNNGYRMDGTFIEQGTAVGLTLDKDYVVVYRASGEKVPDTSLIHELVHASIRALSPDNRGDPDHEGDKYPGWTKNHTRLIKEANEILKLMDLRNAEKDKKDYEVFQTNEKRLTTEDEHVRQIAR